jgi:hypothetical protein
MAHEAESFHPVPSIRRMREKHAGAKNDGADHGPVTKTEVERHEDGSATVTAHHADGHVQEHHHPTEADAHDHAKDMMSGGDAMRSDGEVDTEPDGTCPNCGAKMVDGECPQCGYESPDKAKEEKSESPEFEAGEQEGAQEY